MEKVPGRRIYYRTRDRRAALGERERCRLAQLGACLILFLVILFTKGGDGLAPLRQGLKSAVRNNVDFQAAFTDLGWALSTGKPMGETLGELCSDVFWPCGGGKFTIGYRGPLCRRAGQDLSRGRTASAILVTRQERRALSDPMAGSGAKKAEPFSEKQERSGEPAVIHMDYTGPALPENTTMDRYDLCLPQMEDPVQGVESSGFGWRDHPIEGGEKFHYGVDLAVDTGTTIRAFAAGKVDYIGESDIYGQYLQLDHGNGIKSFYAHCSKLCVRKGQPIAVGEKVAESGATGDVTGPHLHFELKRNGVRLNPDYYIHTLV